jgi:uncharacterized protein
MQDSELVSKTADFVKNQFEDESTGHDWWHLYRVWQLSKTIANTEKKQVNMLVVELAALLHDIADHKFHGGDTEIGAKEAGKWLKQLDTPEEVVNHVQDIVRNISFLGVNHKINLKTQEGQIVHDADKLDAMGAIGIARVFAFGGAHGRLIYSPDISLIEDYAFDKTNAKNSTALHHFYEKLLLLKDRMFTETGKKMALQRHEYMESYLNEFYAEWDGKI